MYTQSNTHIKTYKCHIILIQKPIIFLHLFKSLFNRFLQHMKFGQRGKCLQSILKSLKYWYCPPYSWLSFRRKGCLSISGFLTDNKNTSVGDVRRLACCLNTVWTPVKHVWHCLASVWIVFEHCNIDIVHRLVLFEHRLNTCPTVWHVFKHVQTLQLVMCVKNWTTPELLQTSFPRYSGLHSCTTPVYIPALLRCTFPCYSGVHSHATPVHTPVLLQSTTGLDRTSLDLPFDWTRAWLDMGSSCHSPVTYVPISRHLYLLVLSLFPAHIYFHLPISTSVVFASHWQWLRYAFHLLISPLLTYCTSLGTYCPLSSFCQCAPFGVLFKHCSNTCQTCLAQFGKCSNSFRTLQRWHSALFGAVQTVFKHMSHCLACVRTCSNTSSGDAHHLACCLNTVWTLVKHVWHCLASVWTAFEHFNIDIVHRLVLFKHCSNTCPNAWHVFKHVWTLQVAMRAVWHAVRTVFELHARTQLGTSKSSVCLYTDPHLFAHQIVPFVFSTIHIR